MREIISQGEMIYKNRRIAPVIRDLAESLPVVVIAGARQVGKSTRLRTDDSSGAHLLLADFHQKGGRFRAGAWTQHPAD